MSLQKIQAELKAPKGQYNSFGKYKYRSAEDILEAVKPLLAKYKMTLTLSDTLEYIGDRYYIKAVATIKGDEEITVTAYAREEETKKGMDGSQITGTASSYARKYALNGLFLIDDTKDADTDAYAEQTDVHTKQTTDKKETTEVDEKDRPNLVNEIGDLMESMNLSPKKVYEKIKIDNISQLDTQRMPGCIKWLNNLSDKEKGELKKDE